MENAKLIVVAIFCMLSARGGMWLQEHNAWEIDVKAEKERIVLYENFCTEAKLGNVVKYDKYSFTCSSGVEIRALSLLESYTNE